VSDTPTRMFLIKLFQLIGAYIQVYTTSLFRSRLSGCKECATDFPSMTFLPLWCRTAWTWFSLDISILENEITRFVSKRREPPKHWRHFVPHLYISGLKLIRFLHFCTDHHISKSLASILPSTDVFKDRWQGTGRKIIIVR